MTARIADIQRPVRRPRVPVVVVSPHLDDGVLGCGRWLAAHPGSIVMTVFAGLPARSDQQTDWDRSCGFANAAEAVATRRLEDSQALAALQARPLWLQFSDSQYGQPADAASVARAMAAALGPSMPELLLFPLGLFHSDHLLVHEATRLMLAELATPPHALAYEDVLYRGMQGQMQQRLIALAEQGLAATPARLQATEQHREAKATAMAAYISQHRAFGARGWDDAAQPERFWELAQSAVPDEAGRAG